jgi:hypothetical protein
MKSLVLGLIALSVTSSLACSAQSGSSTSATEVAAVTPPAVFFVDLDAGPAAGGPDNLGVPISIFGKGFGTQRASGRVSIGGVEVSSYLVWGANNAHNSTLDMIVVQPGPRVRGGPIIVTVNGQASNADHSFTINSGKIYYVATNGSDTNPCSATAPCATMLHTTSIMKPGDTVLVRGGVFTEGEVWIRAPQGGTASQPKVIKNYPGEEAYLANAARDILIDADYITVSGLNFQNGKAISVTGWASREQRGVKLFNNTFAGTIGYAAIEITGNDHVIAGNVCDVKDSNQGTMGHCYYITQGNTLKILYNIGSGAPGYGLHIYDERRANPDFQRVISNVLVEGNILKASKQRSGMILAMADAGNYGNRIENVTVRNNIFAGNNHAGLMVTGISRNVRIYNNTFYQNGRMAVYVENDKNIDCVDFRNNLIYQSPNTTCSIDCSNFTQAHIQVGSASQNVRISNNSYHPGAPIILGRTDSAAVAGAVKFASAAAVDFHVLAGSVTIDRGLTLAEVPADYDGRRRPNGSRYDIGAFEYQSYSPLVNDLATVARLLPEPDTPVGLSLEDGRLRVSWADPFRLLPGHLFPFSWLKPIR